MCEHNKVHFTHPSLSNTMSNKRKTSHSSSPRKRHKKDTKSPNDRDFNDILMKFTTPCDIFTRSVLLSHITSVDLVTKHLGEGTFSDCTHLKLVVLHDVELIGPKCFSGCTSLSDFHLPASCVKLGYKCFKGSGITSINLQGVENVGEWCFQDCQHLSNIGEQFSDKIMRSGVFCGCSALKSLKLRLDMTKIEHSAFEGTGIINLDLPLSIGHLGHRCFAGCVHLKTLILPKKIENLPNDMCNGNIRLADVVTGKKIKSIGADCFKNCSSLPEFQVYSPCSTIKKGAFEGCLSLQTFQACIRYKIIHERTFYGCCNLESVTCTPEKIKSEAFEGCIALTSLPDSSYIQLIGPRAFANTGITSAIFDSWCVRNLDIQKNAFSGCHLDKLTIANKDVKIDSTNLCKSIKVLDLRRNKYFILSRDKKEPPIQITYCLLPSYYDITTLFDIFCNAKEYYVERFENSDLSWHVKLFCTVDVSQRDIFITCDMNRVYGKIEHISQYNRFQAINGKSQFVENVTSFYYMYPYVIHSSLNNMKVMYGLSRTNRQSVICFICSLRRFNIQYAKYDVIKMIMSFFPVFTCPLMSPKYFDPHDESYEDHKERYFDVVMKYEKG